VKGLKMNINILRKILYSLSYNNSKVEDEIISIKFIYDLNNDLFEYKNLIKLNKLLLKNSIHNNYIGIRKRAPKIKDYFINDSIKIDKILKLFLKEYRYRFSKIKNIEDLLHLMSIFYISFLELHPFDNGNGRTIRLFICQLCLKYDISIITIDLDNYMLIHDMIEYKEYDKLYELFKKKSQEDN